MTMQPSGHSEDPVEKILLIVDDLMKRSNHTEDMLCNMIIQVYKENQHQQSSGKRKKILSLNKTTNDFPSRIKKGFYEKDKKNFENNLRNIFLDVDQRFITLLAKKLETYYDSGHRPCVHIL